MIVTASDIKVLIVDDDELLCQLLAAFVTERGGTAVCAYDYSEAIARFADERPDVALIDYTLPTSDGLSLLLELRRRNEGRWFPALIISAHEGAEFIQACYEGGADDYIIKPFDFLLLDIKIKALARIADLQKQLSRHAAELQLYYEFSEAENQYASYLYERLVEQDSAPLPGVDYWLQPSSRFSGDLVLFEKGRNGDLYFLLADATGHGLSAAISLIPLTQTFRAMGRKGFQLPSITAEMNRLLRRYSPGDRFVAAVVGQLSHARETLSVWNGGIPAALWLDGAGRVQHEFKSRHLPLGLTAPDDFEADVESRPYTGEEGYLFCYSDGVLEAQDAQGHFFGYEGLAACLETHHPEKLIFALRKALLWHSGVSFTDDVSMAFIDLAKASRTDIEADLGQSRPLIPPCSWQLHLSGSQIAKTDIVPLCLHWFESVGMGAALSQRLFTVLSELVTNAVDHGLLGLESSLKERLDGFVHYLTLREQRLFALDDSANLSVAIALEQDNGRQHIVLSVKDSGPGFDASQLGAAGSQSGRGLGLVRRLAEKLEFRGNGNEVVAILSTTAA